ncbi:hypothetical protein KFK09_024186 [Dendrobium nobile]|uniref:Uncharacterized protein n=1 Tax=Dendrobium nobile TaxID=94219 RepID=A0A8T3AIN1_DENNO|nr:hypothetical protein KFK09_024186 [Dendrobium nobile]
MPSKKFQEKLVIQIHENHSHTEHTMPCQKFKDNLILLKRRNAIRKGHILLSLRSYISILFFSEKTQENAPINTRHESDLHGNSYLKVKANTKTLQIFSKAPRKSSIKDI